MENLSLLYPMEKKPSFQILSDETYNDLSLDRILDFITEKDSEKKDNQGYNDETRKRPRGYSLRK